MTSPFPVLVGWDSREDIAYQVCRHSMLRRSSVPLDVQPLKQPNLRAAGLYAREADPLASTEFTYTRFLVPHLRGYEGWALFVDCDFLWLEDIAELLALRDPHCAVMCVQHDYRPTETLKMDGVPQTRYPRKNWSSLMLWNCGHPANRMLGPEVVNRESGAFLHRFQWLPDSAIGALPERWNWLEGWSAADPAGRLPGAVHYTRGGPWFAEWTDVVHGDLWIAERDDWERGAQAAE
ncbi:MAG: glycosyltransferase [Alphaproteobacteria bacterium]